MARRVSVPSFVAQKGTRRLVCLTAYDVITAGILDDAGVDLILVWNEGRAVACERMCPHEQADLSLGHLSRGRLCCPRHAASFDLRDGQISYGWPSRPLRLYSVRISDDQVWIDAGAIRTPIS